MSYLTHLECTGCGARITPDVPRNSHCGGGAQIFARYDLERIAKEVPRTAVGDGPSTLWRYAALLPAARPQDAVTFDEGYTPLLRVPRLATATGCSHVWLKDEGRNPSGTFKDRGSAVAVTRYRELGVATVALNSSGNAAGSWSMYAARAGIGCVSVLPEDVQPASQRQCTLSGGRAYILPDWHAAGRVVAEACARHGWLNVNTLKEPYRVEGKKTMGLEIAEQLGWELPDVVIYPMGGGLGAIAIWKAFEELSALGWVRGKLPRLIVTQYEGCAPLVKAFDEGRDDVVPWGELDVPPGGLKSPNPPGGKFVLELLRRYGGTAVTVSTAEAIAATQEIGEREGIFSCPESATTLAGLRKALARGAVKASERIVLINTGSGLKSIPVLPKRALPTICGASEVS